MTANTIKNISETSKSPLRALKSRKLNLVLGSIAIVLAACGGETSQTVNTQAVPVVHDSSTENKAGQVQAKESAVGKSEFDPELWPKRETSPPRDAKIEARVAEVLAQMSVEEKVGQIMQPELKYVTPEDVKNYHIGSVLNGGGTTPNNNKFATVEDWANLAQQFYDASMDKSDGKVSIPLIWGSDAVHGNNNVYGATLFPHNIGLGAAGDRNGARYSRC